MWFPNISNRKKVLIFLGKLNFLSLILYNGVIFVIIQRKKGTLGLKSWRKYEIISHYRTDSERQGKE